MKNSFYFGNSIDMVNHLVNSGLFSISVWVCEKRMLDRLLPIAEHLGIPIIGVSSHSELEKCVEQHSTLKLAIMYSFGIIVTSSVLSQIDVYNFHPGSLERNRGRNPIEWAIILGWNYDEMSLHKIDEGIDTGVLLGSQIVNISRDDTPISLLRKMNDTIPELLFCLEEYLEGHKKGTPVKSGIYRHRITEKDFTIFDGDSELVIRNKIRSQVDYNGAILYLNGKKLNIKSFEEYQKSITAG